MEHIVTKALAWTNILELSIQKGKGSNKRTASRKQASLIYRRELFFLLTIT
jgi:hypothetical protein